MLLLINFFEWNQALSHIIAHKLSSYAKRTGNGEAGVDYQGADNQSLTVHVSWQIPGWGNCLRRLLTFLPYWWNVEGVIFIKDSSILNENHTQQVNN